MKLTQEKINELQTIYKQGDLRGFLASEIDAQVVSKMSEKVLMQFAAQLKDYAETGLFRLDDEVSFKAVKGKENAFKLVIKTSGRSFSIASLSSDRKNANKELTSYQDLEDIGFRFYSKMVRPLLEGLGKFKNFLLALGGKEQEEMEKGIEMTITSRSSTKKEQDNKSKEGQPVHIAAQTRELSGQSARNSNNVNSKMEL